MSWEHDHPMDLSPALVDESSSADNKSPISYTSDIITLNDDISMSKKSSLIKNPTIMKQSEDQNLDNCHQGKNSFPATTLAATTSSPEENAIAAPVTSQDLNESFQQHRGQDFPKNPSTSQSSNGNDGSSGLNDYTNQQQANKITFSDGSGAATTMAPSRQGSSGMTSASIIDQLLPRSSQAALSWASAYSMPSIYSTFGVDINYQAPGVERSSAITSSVSGLASSSINDGLNLSAISNRTFPAMDTTNFDAGNRGDNRPHLMDNFDNQLNTSDVSSNLFSNEPSYKPDQSKATDYHRPSDSIASNRTYSSVLHNPSQMSLAMLQQQQQHRDHLHQQQQQQQQQQAQKQPAGRLSLLDARQQQVSSSDLLTNLNNQSSLISTDYSKSLSPSSHRQQLNNTQARLLHDFMSSANNQQSYSSVANRYQQAHTTIHASTNTSDNFSQHGGPSSYNTFQAKGSPMGGRHLVSGSNTIQHRNTSDKAFSSSSATTSNTAVKRRNKLPFFAAGNMISGGHHGGGLKLDTFGSPMANSDSSERFSRKVFVGGLPPDIDEEEIKASFRRFGALIVDWPHKAESKSYFPPKGYAFLLFQEETSVQTLIDACFQEEDKLYLCVSSPTIKDKPVQIRPWRLSDTDFVLDSTLALDPRKTVFVGGVPRPLKASELAKIINNLYGGVCYAGIDTDPELKYPKGAGRVAFSNHQSYIAAISARFVHIQHSEIEKRVEVKPYVLDDQFCDECQGSRCGNKFAPFFCANITCLRYFCDNCWSTVHSQGGREFHKPLVKEGGDRPRGAQSFRW